MYNFSARNKKIETVAKELVNKLNEHNLGAYFWYQAEWGTCYIEFIDNWKPTILVGNGIKNETEDYIFNMREDIRTLTKEWDEDLNMWRIHVPTGAYSLIVNYLEQYIPKYKKLKFK